MNAEHQASLKPHTSNLTPEFVKRPRKRVCFRIDTELYTEFRHACLDIGAIVGEELEDCVVRKLQAWRVKQK